VTPDDTMLHIEEIFSNLQCEGIPCFVFESYGLYSQQY
jgi:hypothetical protein